MVYATNLIQALPNEAETIKAIQNLDLLVVVDVIPSEIAGWADVVLPEAVYLERYDDLNVEWFREPFVALRQPVVEAPNDQKPNWWIAKKLAEKLGLGAYFPWADVEEYLDTRLKSAGLSLAQLKEQGLVRGPKQPIYFDEGAAGGVRHPVGQDRVLLAAARRRRLRPGAEVHAAGRAAAGRLPPALRAGAGALLQPHPDQSAARRDDERERGVGERRRGAAGWA